MSASRTTNGKRVPDPPGIAEALAIINRRRYFSAKKRQFADLILEGHTPEEAKEMSGYSEGSSVHDLMASRSFKEYMIWRDRQQKVSTEDVRQTAILRLTRLLQDNDTPPMVHAVAARIALEHWKHVQGMSSDRDKLLPGEFVEVTKTIRMKLLAAKDPGTLQIGEAAIDVTSEPVKPRDDASPEMSYPAGSAPDAEDDPGPEAA